MTTDPTAPCTICHQRPPRDPSGICGGCYARTRGDLNTLAWAHTWLGVAMLTPGTSWKPGTLHRAPGPQPPYGLQYHDQREQIEAVLSSWVTAVAYEGALAGPADKTVTGLTAWLRIRLPWISEQSWCRDFATELSDQRAAAHALAPWERGRRDLPVPCPRCGLLTLSLYGGDDGVTCRNRECGEMIAWYRYDREVRKWHDRMTIQTATAA
jgi:hypothetical protein